MSRTLTDNIDVISNSVALLEAGEPVCGQRILELEDMFRLCDRMVECSSQTPSTLRRYNELRCRYKDAVDPYRRLNSEISACRMHVEALNRQNSIISIARGVREIVAVSDYIGHVVHGEQYSIDSIAHHLEQGERYGELANNHMSSISRRRSLKTRVIRLALLVLLVLASAIIFVKTVF